MFPVKLFLSYLFSFLKKFLFLFLFQSNVFWENFNLFGFLPSRSDECTDWYEICSQFQLGISPSKYCIGKTLYFFSNLFINHHYQHQLAKRMLVIILTKKHLMVRSKNLKIHQNDKWQIYTIYIGNKWKRKKNNRFEKKCHRARHLSAALYTFFLSK